MHSGFRAWVTAAFVILIWGITFVNTRALLEEFSALEILVGRIALAWAALARILCRGAQTTVCKFWVGSAMAIAGVALISFNNAVVFELRPLGDLMALGAMVSWGCYSIPSPASTVPSSRRWPRHSRSASDQADCPMRWNSNRRVRRRVAIMSP